MTNPPGQARDASGSRDAAVDARRNAFPCRDHPRVRAAVLSDFARHRVRRRFCQSRQRCHQPNTISAGAEDNRADRSHSQIGQNLPGITPIPALRESECQLAAVSQARGYPGHGENRRERDKGRWSGAGKKQEAGKTTRQRSRWIDAAQGTRQHRKGQSYGYGDCEPRRGGCPGVR